jgi:ATP-dependent Lon protease
MDDAMSFFPLMDDNNSNDDILSDLADSFPLLALRNLVVFPGMVMPISIGRKSSLELVKTAERENLLIGTVTQKEATEEHPKENDLYRLGTIAKVMKVIELPDNTVTALIQGIERFRLNKVLSYEPFIVASGTLYPEKLAKRKDKLFDATIETVKELSIKIIEYAGSFPDGMLEAIKNFKNDRMLLAFVCSNIDIPIEEKQKLLATTDIRKRADKLLKLLGTRVQIAELKNRIQNKVKVDLNKQQHDYLLTQQIREMQKELGDNPTEQEFGEMEEAAKKKKWNKTVADHFEKELKKLRIMNPMVPDYSIQVNYLRTLLDLPWNEYTKDNFNLKHAEKVLNRDHYGLEEVKERILEYLAVLKLKGNLKTPILCLYGPPGVGKTSLGKSIAEALGRKYIRLSLGGLHDEAEIRGHRKTYIGAMPGRIVQNMKKAKSSNPVFVLDEIDKVGQDFRGDPSSALLEVLDPEQNNSFYDNFLELEYDLSKTLFIGTANTLSTISPALRDRMEMIEVTGYTTEEKIEIARRHLIKKQLEEHGLKPKDLIFSKKVIEKLITDYTRESGVRALDKVIAKVIRKYARKIAAEESFSSKIKLNDLRELLGPRRFFSDSYENNDFAGVVVGLAWTSVGGSILFVETSLSKGKGSLTITGNLGNVMKESATIALQYLKAHARHLDLDATVFEHWNVHLHVPEGAIPKDGPSAGITMATALASAFTQRKVKPFLAMTGEITLRGKVLPVGGIKEKMLAAKRAGIKELILSEENRVDIEKLKDDYRKDLTFHYVRTIEEVFDIALLPEKVEDAIDLMDYKNQTADTETK